MNNILDMSIDDLIIWLKNNNIQKYRAKQIFDWIYIKLEFDFKNMISLPQSLRELLSKNFFIGIPEVISEYKSSDTVKLLLKYDEKSEIECVIMKYSYGTTICISTQVGCRMGCNFCASTLGGLVRNMSSGEMLGEVLRASKMVHERISNVVLMGTGEPFDNFDNVIQFIRMVTSEETLNLSQRHITVSTCGIVPNICKFADLKMQVTLAISLHAPNDDIRKKIMPIANKYKIYDIIKACFYYIQKTNKRITFEYAIIKGINDSKECAEELSRVLSGMLCNVNIIPLNSINEKSYEKPSMEAVEKFEKLLTHYGIYSTVRRKMGSDINAACGQLRRKHVEEQLH